MKYLALLSIALLSACGGGSSSPATIPTTPTQPQIDPSMTAPLQKAMSSLVQNGISKNFSVSGFTSSVNKYAITGSGSLVIGPASATTLNGVSALKAVQIISQTIAANGSPSTSTASTTQYYKASDFTKIADDSGTSYNLYANYTIPATVKAGDTGAYSTYINYDSPSQIIAPGNTQSKIVYLVLKDTVNTLLVQFINDTYGDECSAVNESSSSSPICYKAKPASTIYQTHSTQVITTYRISTSGEINPVTIELNRFNTAGAVAQKLIYTF